MKNYTQEDFKEFLKLNEYFENKVYDIMDILYPRESIDSIVYDEYEEKILVNTSRSYSGGKDYNPFFIDTSDLFVDIETLKENHLKFLEKQKKEKLRKDELYKEKLEKQKEEKELLEFKRLSNKYKIKIK